MQLAHFLHQRSVATAALRPERGLCLRCLRPPPSCYCAHIHPLDPGIRFVILSHIREAQKPIATGRMAHLGLKNSVLLVGEDFSADPVVNALLANPSLHCLVLFPGENSTNLSRLTTDLRAGLFPSTKELVVFVIDGTWSTAPKILQKSRNLVGLPRICYDPPHASRFFVRKQPELYCHSTIEAIHHTIKLLKPTQAGDQFLRPFEVMVQQQLAFTPASRASRPT